jgi:hypothetical protein
MVISTATWLHQFKINTVSKRIITRAMVFLQLLKTIKMSIRYRILFLLIVLLAGATQLDAQRKRYRPLGTPEVFSTVVDEELWRRGYAEVISGNATRKKSDDPWVVMSDREGTKTYSKPGGDEVVKTLSFREGPFYVVDEEDRYLEIVKGDLVKGKAQGESYGWVSKDKMLLWLKAVHSESLIPKFVFILYKVDGVIDYLVNRKASEKATIYYGPEEEEVGEEIQIFDFYSVLKREGSRYLLSNEATLSKNPSQSQLKDRVIGWVDINNCTEWNTRIVLEPAFSESAFSERKAESSFQVIGYDKPADASNHAKAGTPNRNEIAWANDPVTLNPEMMSQQNPRRFRGGVMRFPMLSGTRKGATYFRSGVIGDIMLENAKITEADANTLAKLCETWESRLEEIDNINLLYVIQGTHNMKAQKEAIIESIDAATQSFAGTKANIRYSAVIYHNITDENEAGGLLKIQELTKSSDQVKIFIENTEFDNYNSYENANAPVAAFAIKQALQRAGLNQGHTNLVFLIGSDGDFQFNSSLREKFKNHEASIASSEVISELSQNRVQFYTICTESSGKSGLNFLDMAHLFLSRSTINTFNRDLKDTDPLITEKTGKRAMVPFVPPLPDVQEKESIILLENSAIPGGMFIPRKNTSITELSQKISKATDQSNELKEAEKGVENAFCVKGVSVGEAIRSVEESFRDVSSGSLGPKVLERIRKLLIEFDISADILGNRYQLYNEVFFPKKITGANAAMMDHLLFIRDRDVVFYINTIEKILRNAGGASDEQREAIIDIYTTLVQYFTGNKQIDLYNDQYTIGEINNMLYGLQMEGFECPEQARSICKIDLKSVQDPRIVPDSTVEEIIDRFTTTIEHLREEVLGSDFSFKYNTRAGDIYYWIELTKMY